METIISGIFALLLGGVGIWVAALQFRNRRILNTWMTTRGTVIERGTFKPDIPTTSLSAFQHAPLIRYTYQVDGAEFVNNYINPRRIQYPQHNTIKWARKRAASFGSEVTVHYNPADPAESFLIQTPKIKLYILIAASTFAVLYGLLFLLTRLQ